MANITVDILGLKEIKESFDAGKLSKKLQPAFGLAVRQVHSAISFEVKKRYNTSKELSGVMLGGRTSSDLKYSRTILEESLQYKDVPINLAHFLINEEVVTTNTPAWFKGRSGGLHQKNWANRVNVEILRGRKVPVRGYKSYNSRGAFLLKGRHPWRIAIRKTNATWNESISESLTRAPYRYLYGPSLASMANSVFNTTPVQDAINKMELTIIDNFIV